MRILTILFLVILYSCSSSKNNEQRQSYEVVRKAIEATMGSQEKAWSNGNLDEFMLGYWNSSQLTFIGQSGITYGWESTLENYKKAYPSKEQMGKLRFDILEVTRLSDEVYKVLGKFYLDRKSDQLSGYFSLIWKYIEGKWVIISDHTS